MSSYPDPPGEFNSSKRPPDRDRKYRDSRDLAFNNHEQVGRAPHDRADPERERDQRGVQGQGPFSTGRAFDDSEPRERRGYQPRPEERERRDGRERDREPREARDHRERDAPGRDERARRDTDTWPRERERDAPPHQYERKPDSAYDSRKQDGAYGRDAQPRNSNNPNLMGTQSHTREREPPGHREPPMQREREPPIHRDREREAQPPMHRDAHRDPQPPRSALPIMSAPSTLTLHPKPTLLRLRHSLFLFYAYWR